MQPMSDLSRIRVLLLARRAQLASLVRSAEIQFADLKDAEQAASDMLLLESEVVRLEELERMYLN